MSGLRLVCPICANLFTAEDQICATSCGHVLHNACLVEWKRRSSRCPQCSSHAPIDYKLFLPLDGEEDPAIEVQAKLEATANKVLQLEAQLEGSEKNLLALRQQQAGEQIIREKLEQQVLQCANNDAHFLELQGQYTEIENRLRELQERYEILGIEKEFQANELACKQAEIIALRRSYASSNAGAAQSDQNARSMNANASEIAYLREELQKVNTDMQKEIANCNELKLENLRLKRSIQLLNMESIKEEAPKQQQHSEAVEAPKVAPMQTNERKVWLPTRNKVKKHFERAGVVMAQLPFSESIQDQAQKPQQHSQTVEAPKVAPMPANERKVRLPTRHKSQKHFERAGIMMAHLPLSEFAEAPAEMCIKLASLVGVYIDQTDFVGDIEKIRRKNTFDLFFELSDKDLMKTIICQRAELTKVPKYSKVIVKENLNINATDEKSINQYSHLGVISISYIPMVDFTDSPEELVVKLAAVMNVFIKKSDLVVVGKIRHKTTFELFVLLQNKTHLAAIMSNRSELRNIPKYAQIEIKERSSLDH